MSQNSFTPGRFDTRIASGYALQPLQRLRRNYLPVTGETAARVSVEAPPKNEVTTCGFAARTATMAAPNTIPRMLAISFIRFLALLGSVGSRQRSRRFSSRRLRLR